MKREKREKKILRLWKKAVRKWKCTNSFQLIDYAKPRPWSDNRLDQLTIDIIAPGLLRNRKLYPRGQRNVANKRYYRKRGL